MRQLWERSLLCLIPILQLHTELIPRLLQEQRGPFYLEDHQGEILICLSLDLELQAELARLQDLHLLGTFKTESGRRDLEAVGG